MKKLVVAVLAAAALAFAVSGNHPGHCSERICVSSSDCECAEGEECTCDTSVCECTEGEECACRAGAGCSCQGDEEVAAPCCGGGCSNGGCNN